MRVLKQATRDLVVLVPDDAYVKVVNGLLRRFHSLGIRPLDFTVEFHVNRDPGCLKQSALFLRRYLPVFDRALVLFDRCGCGREDLTCEQLEELVQQELQQSGWKNRAGAVVLEPEIEVWVWSDSPHVERCLGWEKQPGRLKRWLVERELWEQGTPKPRDPKKAYLEALRKARKSRSNAIFAQLAESVGLRRCTDRAFIRLREILRRWFPAS